MLQVEEVSSYYGRIQALASVSLTVEEGEIVSLIGANGAGKTTLLKTISGLLRAQQGEILFCGRSIARLSAEEIVGLGIGHVPEHRQLFGSMSVRDNLLLGAYHRFRRGKSQDIRREMELVYQTFPILAEREKQLAGTLSGGEQQMLAVGRGLMARPRLLLLDEPSLGLAPLLVRELFRIIAYLREQGTTILLVEQNARAALKIADRGYVLETGRVVLEGVASELMADDRIQTAYLATGYARPDHRTDIRQTTGTRLEASAG